MENVNIEEYGFTEEEVNEVLETTEVEEQPEGEETQDTPPANVESEETPEGETTEEEQNEGTEENHGDLRKALAEERARRKELQRKAEEYEARLKANATPIESIRLDDSIISDIKTFSRDEAIKRLGIKDDLETLMYTDTEKYNELLKEEAKIEYALTNKAREVEHIRQENLVFIQGIKALPNFNELYELGQKELDAMARKDSNPIDAAFARTGQGVGTKEDFKIINDFIRKLQDKMAEDKKDPLDDAAKLPKANSLQGGATPEDKVTEEMLLNAVANGTENELPPELKKQLKELIG